MAQGSYFIRNIAVAAGTGIGGVTLFGTGRCGDHAAVAVAGSVDNGGFKIVATAAIPALLTVLFAGGIFRYHPLSHIMAQGSYFIRNIAVTAGTGIGGVALFGAGRCGDHGAVAVAGSFDNGGFKIVAAAAIPALLTVLFTGGIFRYHPLPHIMAQSVYFIGNIAVTAGTGVGGVTLFRAGGCGHGCVISMSGCFGIVIGIAVTADRASISGIAALGASGRGNHGGIAVSLCAGVRVRVIGRACQGQNAVRAGAPQVFGVIVISIGQPVQGIAVSGAAGSARQKQAAVLADGTAVGVGHIHQIVPARDAYDVPHMGAACVAGDGITGHITGKGCQIAQVHKGLGIAFTDHIGAGVTVKDMDQLPGVVVGRERTGTGCGVVIGHQIADLCLVAKQLVVIRFGRIGGNNGPGAGGSLHSGACLGNIRGVVVTGAVIVCHREPKPHMYDLSGGRQGLKLAAGHLVVPVHFVGQVGKQSVHQISQGIFRKGGGGEGGGSISGVGFTAVGYRFADADHGGFPLACGDLLENGNDGIIQQLCVSRQPLTGGSTQQREAAAVEDLLGIGVE